MPLFPIFCVYVCTELFQDLFDTFIFSTAATKDQYNFDVVRIQCTNLFTEQCKELYNGTYIYYQQYNETIVSRSSQMTVTYL
jgi:hypothetical protein